MNFLLKIVFVILFLSISEKVVSQHLLIRGLIRYPGVQLSENEFKTCRGEIIKIKSTDIIYTDYDPCNGNGDNITNSIIVSYNGYLFPEEGNPNAYYFKTKDKGTYVFSKELIAGDSLFNKINSDSLITIKYTIDENGTKNVKLIQYQR